TFKSKRVVGEPNSFKVVGDFTMKGVTREITLNARYLGSTPDGYGNLKAAYEAKTKLNRKDFGLTWNNMVEAGPVVGDEIEISLKIQAGKALARKPLANK